MTLNRLRQEQGVALILVLGLLIVIAAVALIVGVTAIMERGLTTSERQQKAVFDAQQKIMERAISRFDPQADANTGVGFPGLVDSSYLGGGTAYRLVSWIGTHFNVNPQLTPIQPVDYPQGMHQPGEAIMFRYALVSSTARMYRVTGGDMVAQKEAQAIVDVGPYGWSP